jgi:DNA-binding protein H-NS
MAVDLDKLSLKELKALQKNVAKAIDQFETRRKAEALSAIESTAKAHGFALSDLVATKGSRKKTPVKPKYARPGDPSVTWSGRGRRPRWVEDALKSGKSLDDLAI